MYYVCVCRSEREIKATLLYEWVGVVTTLK